MTRKKGSWKKKDEEEFIILKNLAIRGPTHSVEFEKINDPIPHASLAKMLHELENNKLIKKIPSEWKSKRGLIVPRFKITLLGLIRLFDITKKSNYEITLTEIRCIIISVQEFIPWIAKNWNNLAKLYDESGMFNLITSISQTIRVKDSVAIENVVGVTSTRVSKNKKATLIVSGLSDDEKIASFGTGFRNVEHHIAHDLTLWFVDGLIRYATSKKSKIHHIPEMYALKNTSQKELMNMMSDPDIEFSYAEHIEMVMDEHVRKIQQLKNINEMLAKSTVVHD